MRSPREGATGRPEEVLDVLGIAFEETRIERTRLIFWKPSQNLRIDCFSKKTSQFS
jgi:hypothetical protein